MKKLAIAMMLGIAAMSASAQVNYKMQVACSPQDVKTYDTNRLRSSFLMEKVMVPNEINVTYSMYDRLIFGGAVPATKELVLETIGPLFSQLDSYTVLFDKAVDMEAEKDTTATSVKIEWIYLKTNKIKRYYFERLKGLWKLEAIDFAAHAGGAGV